MEEVQEQKQADERFISSIYALLHNAEFCPAISDGKVDKVTLYNWITEFKELLEQQNIWRREFSYWLIWLYTWMYFHVNSYCFFDEK